MLWCALFLALGPTLWQTSTSGKPNRVTQIANWQQDPQVTTGDTVLRYIVPRALIVTGFCKVMLYVAILKFWIRKLGSSSVRCRLPKN